VLLPEEQNDVLQEVLVLKRGPQRLLVAATENAQRMGGGHLGLQHVHDFGRVVVHVHLVLGVHCRHFLFEHGGVDHGGHKHVDQDVQQQVDLTQFLRLHLRDEVGEFRGCLGVLAALQFFNLVRELVHFGLLLRGEE